MRKALFRNDRVFGNVMHMVFSRIEYMEDIDKVLTGLLREGVLSIRDRPVIRERILEMMAGEGVSDWFRKPREERFIMNGVSLTRRGEIFRPDRVILDRDLCKGGGLQIRERGE